VKQYDATMESASVKEQFSRQGLETVTSTPEAFGTYLRSEVTKWGEVIQVSGATPE